MSESGGNTAYTGGDEPSSAGSEMNRGRTNGAASWNRLFSVLIPGQPAQTAYLLWTSVSPAFPPLSAAVTSPVLASLAGC